MHPMTCRATALALLGLLAAPLAAQAPAPPPGSSWVELGGFHQPVSHQFGDWTGGYGRAVLSGRRDVWYLEAKYQEAFRDRGAWGSLANVHTFSDRVYTQLAVGGGSGDYVLPDLRLDGSLSMKLGRGRKVIATVGATLVDAKRGYDDKAAFGTLTWYAASGVLLEAGARFNTSNPGGVGSGRGTGAITLGRVGNRTVTLRGSAGTEGYQLTGTGAPLRRFRSQDAGIAWREWFGTRWGMVIGGDWYHNPFYTRAGATLGVFRAW